jgi:hypothetical protein
MKETTEKEPSTVLTPDTPNATYFDPSENNTRGEHYRRLRLYNRGTWKDRREENKEVRHRADNLSVLDAISSQVELNPYQKKEARRFLDTLNLQDLGMSISVVSFGICAVVANEDVHDGTRYWPTSNDTDDLFREIARNLHFTESQQLSIIHKLRGERRQ